MTIDKRLVNQVGKLQHKIEQKIDNLQKYILDLEIKKKARIDMIKNEGEEKIKLKCEIINRKFNNKIEKCQNMLNDIKSLLEKLKK